MIFLSETELRLADAVYDWQKLAAQLRARGIRLERFADAGYIGRSYFSLLLHEHRSPGEATRIRIGRALAHFDIPVTEVMADD